MQLNWRQHVRIGRAAAVLHAGGVVACPTEAVWGLSCAPFNASAVSRILQLKKRQQGMGLILVASSMAQLSPFLAGLSASQLEQVQQTWPGPYTWLVPDNGAAPSWVTGGRPTLAVRVSAHPVVAALCDAFGGPLVSTSANPHGMPSARTALKVRSYFRNELDDILPGVVGPSTRATSIRDLVSGAIIRLG